MRKKVRAVMLIGLLSVFLTSCSGKEGNKGQNELTSEATESSLETNSENLDETLIGESEDKNQSKAAFDKELWEKNLVFLNYNVWIHQPDNVSGLKEMNSFSAATLKSLYAMTLVECPNVLDEANNDSGYFVIRKSIAEQYIKEAFNLELSSHIKDEVPGPDIIEDGDYYKIGLGDFGEMMQQCDIEDIRTEGNTALVSGVLKIEVFNTDSEYSKSNQLFIYDESTSSAVWERSFTAEFIYHPEGVYTKHQLVKIDLQDGVKK